MTYRQYISEVIDAGAPRFDGRDAERLSWMRGMLAHYQKHRHEIEHQAASDWWMDGDERWGKVA